MRAARAVAGAVVAVALLAVCSGALPFALAQDADPYDLRINFPQTDTTILHQIYANAEVLLVCPSRTNFRRVPTLNDYNNCNIGQASGSAFSCTRNQWFRADLFEPNATYYFVSTETEDDEQKCTDGAKFLLRIDHDPTCQYNCCGDGSLFCIRNVMNLNEECVPQSDFNNPGAVCDDGIADTVDSTCTSRGVCLGYRVVTVYLATESVPENRGRFTTEIEAALEGTNLTTNAVEATVMDVADSGNSGDMVSRVRLRFVDEHITSAALKYSVLNMEFAVTNNDGAQSLVRFAASAGSAGTTANPSTDLRAGGWSIVYTGVVIAAGLLVLIIVVVALVKRSKRSTGPTVVSPVGNQLFPEAVTPMVHTENAIFYTSPTPIKDGGTNGSLASSYRNDGAFTATHDPSRDSSFASLQLASSTTQLIDAQGHGVDGDAHQSNV